MGYYLSPKIPRGLGIENLKIKNKCILRKWLFRLSQESEGMWAQLHRNKYLHSKTLAHVIVRPNDSPFCKGLMRVKETFFHRLKFIVGDGTTTRFWEDTWLGDTPLALEYPSLYHIAQRKEDYVVAVMQM